MSSEKPVLTYGNWRVPKTAGLGKLSLAQSLSFVGILMTAVILNMFLGPLWALAWLVTSSLALWLTYVQDRHGVSLAVKAQETMKFRKTRRRKQHVYLSGPLAPHTRTTSCELPGIVGNSYTSEHTDAYGRPFAVIHHHDGTVAIAMSATPPGVGLVDEEVIDNSVARWGLWLGNLSGETGVVGAQVVIETVPDTGARLRREVSNRMDPNAPGLARDVLKSVIVSYRQGAAIVRGYVTITLDPAMMGIKETGKERDKRIASDIASRLPGLTSGLERGTGAGAVHLMTRSDLCRVVRVAYDPAAESIFEDAVARGEEVHIDWKDVGPLHHEATRTSYLHDSGHSRTWVMTSPPRGAVQSGVLSRLLEPHRDVERKRVTMLYRPIDVSIAPDLVESDLNKARARVEGARVATARMHHELAAAKQVADEEADGATLLDFGIVVTATSTQDRLVEESAAIQALAASSRILIRPAYGVQDAAFALGLPLGLRPQTSMKVGAGRW